MISVFYDHILEAETQSGLTKEVIMERLKKTGLEAVDISRGSLVGREEEMKNFFNKAGLKIASIYCQFDFGNNGNPQPGFDLVDLAQKMGAKNVLIIPGFVHVRWKWFRKMVMSNMAEVLKKICKYGTEKEITVSLEDFDDWKAPFSTIQDLKWFVDKVPGLGITFDTGNFLYQEQDEIAAFQVLSNHIVHVHMKDRSFDKKEGETYKSTILGNEMYSAAVGTGIIHMEELALALKNIGYSGSYTAEHFGSQRQLADMETSILWLKEHV